MTKSMIEKIVIIAVAAAVALAMGLTFIISYSSYKSSLPEPPAVPKLTSIRVSMDDEIESGKNFDSLGIQVTGIYDNGRSEKLDEEDYLVTFSPELGEAGAAVNTRYTCKVTLKENKDIFAENGINVTTRLEGENAKIVGGAAKTENGYSFAGDFKPDETECYVEFSVPCFGNVNANLELCVSNGNLRRDFGSDTSWMEPLQVNMIADLSVNGEPVEIPDDVICPGTEKTTYENWASLYSIFNVFEFKDVPLNDGSNLVRLTLKSSTEVQNSWGETPTMNIDYVRVIPTGGEAYENAKTEKAEYNGDSDVTISGEETIGSVINGGNYPVTFICDNGLLYYAGIDEFDISVSSGKSVEDVGRIGETYVVTAKHKTSEAEFSVNVDVSNVLEAENATIVGGKSTTENGNTFAGNFNTNKNEENYVEFAFEYYKTETRDITLRVSNGYLLLNEETDMYRMGELQLNSIMDITVNGSPYNLSDDVKLSESEENASSTPLYGNFEDVILENVQLKEGANTVRVSLKLSTLDQTTCWENGGPYGGEYESPVVNIDKITVETDAVDET